MKKIIFGIAAVTLSVIASHVQAQEVARVLLHEKGQSFYEAAPAGGSRIIPINEVNMNAVRDFSKKFSKAEDAIWVDNEAGTSVYFVLGGYKMRCTYDKGGKREYTLKYYDDASMPKELRHLVKSTYYDFNIIQVTEVERRSIKSYLVKMQSDKEFLTVKVTDGEMIVYERINREN